MWTTLAVTALVTSTATVDVTASLTPGTEVRLTAGQAVHVPGLFSRTSGSYTVRGQPVRRDGLLVFARGDGASEGVIAPGATVQGTLAGGDPDYVYLRRGAGAPERIHRASIARVQTLAGSGRATGKGTLIGGAIGAGLGLALFVVLTEEGSDSPPSLEGLVTLSVMGGTAGLGVGAGIGALSSGGRWREVPLATLPGGERPATGAVLTQSWNDDIGTTPAGIVESRGALAPDRLLTVPPRPLRRAVEALGSGGFRPATDRRSPSGDP